MFEVEILMCGSGENEMKQADMQVRLSKYESREIDDNSRWFFLLMSWPCFSLANSIQPYSNSCG